MIFLRIVRLKVLVFVPAGGVFFAVRYKKQSNKKESRQALFFIP